MSDSQPDLFEARPPGDAGLDPAADTVALARSSTPLAARMRPRTLDEFAGQERAVGPGTILRRALESDTLPSMILWGPPGSGKTSLANILAEMSGAAFEVSERGVVGCR